MNDAPLSRRTTVYVVVASGVAAAVAALLALSGTSTEEEEAADEQVEELSEPASDPQAAVDWLPYEPEELAEAGQLAVEFTELYTRVTDGESSEGHHEELSEMATSDYAQRLEPSESAAAARQEMLEQGVTISTSAEVAQIRDVLTGQVTMLVDCATVTDTDQGQQTEDYEFAVTLLPEEDGWQVHELQLAESGQSGDESGGIDY